MVPLTEEARQEGTCLSLLLHKCCGIVASVYFHMSKNALKTENNGIAKSSLNNLTQNTLILVLKFYTIGVLIKSINIEFKYTRLCVIGFANGLLNMSSIHVFPKRLTPDQTAQSRSHCVHSSVICVIILLVLSYLLDK